MPVVLTPEQRDAVFYLIDFNARIQTLGGYAGTGKTTVIKTLKQKLPDFAVCAFTGKAANVLRRKQVAASTIHSLIYKVIEAKRKDALGKERSFTEFKLRTPDELDCRGIIVDEASMVSREIYNDLVSFDLPVIFVGDHGQLEPVGGEGFNLMEKLDVKLEKVHRNAGEILHFANFLREGNPSSDWRRHELCTGEGVDLIRFSEVREIAPKADQMICAFNRHRVIYNQQRREQLGRPANRPVVGDRVMCLQNQATTGVYNGMQGTIAALFGDDEMEFSANDRDYRVKFFPAQFNRIERERYSKSIRLPFDYCYCITAHKAQGDEWDHVLAIEQICPAWEHQRWAYTVASRARTRLSWVCA